MPAVLCMLDSFYSETTMLELAKCVDDDDEHEALLFTLSRIKPL